MKMISILSGVGRISAPSGCSIGSYLCTTGYEKYHYGNHYFLYSAVYSRTELQKIIGGAIPIAVPLLIIFLSIVVQPDQTLIKDYQRTRIMSFLYPENEEYQEDIEQQNNSKTAIASGELVGKKLTGDDQVSSVNAGNFVAENQTDFIFAVAGEEYGFIGCTTLVVLLLLISVECIRMSLRAKDLAGKIICCGIGSVVAIQSFLNICVATGLAPNTGTPLPFVSYGLTSLVSLFYWYGACDECRSAEQYFIIKNLREKKLIRKRNIYDSRKKEELKT